MPNVAVASNIKVTMARVGGGELIEFHNVIDADLDFDIHNRSSYDEASVLGKSSFLLKKGYMYTKGEVKVIISKNKDKKLKATLEAINKVIEEATKTGDPDEYTRVFSVIVLGPSEQPIATVSFRGFILEVPTECSPDKNATGEDSYPEVHINIYVYDHNTTTIN